MVYRETLQWPAVREEEVLALVSGGEQRDTVLLSSYDNVAPVEAVDVDPSRGLTQNQKVYRAGTVLAKITTDVGGGEAESGKWGPFDPSATDDGRDQQRVGFLATGVVGNNNAIRFSARQPGPAGHQITVTLTDPGLANQSLAVSVANQFDIDVSLATDGAGAITSTAAEVIAAVNAHAEAGQLVQAADEGDSDGTGVVSAEAQANLAGAQAEVELAVLPVDVNVEFGDVAAGVYVGGATYRQDKLRGYSGNEANVDAALGDRDSRVMSVTEVTP